MKSFLISVLGDDKPGLVDGLSKIIVSNNGDWIESNMSSFEGKFAGILKVNVPTSDAAKLKKTDPFLSFGIEMVVSGYSGPEIRDILTTTIESSFGRNMVPAKILGKIGGLCPAFGMVGTLVGLVIMLGNLSDPSSLGPSLSIALITTLYGVLFAQLLFSPCSEKMTQREQIVRFRNYLVAEGLVMLAEKKPPRYIQDRMNSFLDPAIHFNIDKDKQ